MDGEDFLKYEELEDGTRVRLRLMEAGDADRVQTFFAQLPPDDRLFLKYDLTRPEVMAVFEKGGYTVGYQQALMVLAEHEDQIAGIGSLRRHDPDWTDHVGEIWLVVAPAYRRKGLGRVLTRSILDLAVAAGLEKIVAEMPADQLGAVEVFQRFGFAREGLLTNYVKTADGRKRDLLLMSHDLEHYQGRAQYLGALEEYLAVTE